MIKLSAKLSVNRDLILAPNLCDRFSSEDLTTIGKDCYEGYRADRLSRAPWEKRTSAAMDFAMQIAKDKNFPWQGAANIIFPLITIASLQFAARAYPTLVQGTDVVKYRVIGMDPKGETKLRAERIARHMSWQVLEEDEAWEEQHDRLLINEAVVGCAFIKTYFGQGHNNSELVMARDLVMDYWAKSVEKAARKTHVVPFYRNDIWEEIENGRFKDVRREPWFQEPAVNRSYDSQRMEMDNRLGRTANPARDNDQAFLLLEQHRWYDFDRDGYAEPYIVTIDENTQQVLGIVARFNESDVERDSLSGRVRRIRAEEYFTKYPFIPSPDGGIYDLGFGALLGPIDEAVSTAINQLLDSGTFQNSIGGFLGRGAKIRGGVYSMAPWEWKRVDSTGDDLRKNLIPFPDRQPLTVTLQLIELLIEYADRLAGTTETLVGESPGQNTPAETSRNMTEQGMKVYSAVFKRNWRSMREEFKKLYKLNRNYLVANKTFGAGDDFIRREDYTGNVDQIAPVADPNITSTAMQVYQAEAVRQAAYTTPGYDRDEAARRWLKALKVENIDTLYLGEKKAEPLPNPKMMVEQAKLQAHQMKIEADKIHWANELLQKAPLVQAQIDLLKAQVVEIISSIGAQKAAQQIEAFELAIKAWETYHSAVTDRIKTLTEGKTDASPKGNSDGGGVQRVAAPPDDADVQRATQSVSPQLNGAMGGGAVPG